MRMTVVVMIVLALHACTSVAKEVEVQYINGNRMMDTTELIKYHEYLSYYFDTLLNYRDFSGGILVAKNGKILYEHYQGDEYGGKMDTINERTPFHVASTSKTFTSTAILQLVAKGKLNVDDSVIWYLPEFPYKDVTIRNLLNHSAGLQNYANFLPRYKWNRKVTASNRDVLAVMAKHKPAQEFKTGTRFRYSNTNFTMLALVVEQLSGLTFPEYVQQYIFDVAGMEDSYILTHTNAGDYMPSWNEQGRIYNYEYLDGLYGDKNVFTTCRDLMKYDEAIRKGLLMGPEQYEMAWEPNFKDASNRDPSEFYGLGWRLKVFNNNLKIPYHNGWWHGNNAVFQRLIADTAVIIITGNRMNRRIYTASKLANLFRPYYYNGVDHSYELDTFFQRTEPLLFNEMTQPAAKAENELRIQSGESKTVTSSMR